jgi:hypothetical protein
MFPKLIAGVCLAVLCSASAFADATAHSWSRDGAMMQMAQDSGEHMRGRSWHRGRHSWRGHARARSWHRARHSWGGHRNRSSWHYRQRSWHSTARSWDARGGHMRGRSQHRTGQSWDGRSDGRMRHRGRVQPYCRDVGGYEAYMRRTGEVCRLY